MSFNSLRPLMMPSITSMPLIELAQSTLESALASTIPIDLSNILKLSWEFTMTPTGTSETPTQRCKGWSGKLITTIRPVSRTTSFPNTARLLLRMFGDTLPQEQLLEILKLLLWITKQITSMLCIPTQWLSRSDTIGQQSRLIWLHASTRNGDLYHSFILSFTRYWWVIR